MGDVPEQVHLDAARLSVDADPVMRGITDLQFLIADPSFRAAVASAYRAGQATPDGPRRWALPDEPGPEVTALQDRLGRTWSRVRGLPLWGSHGGSSALPFVDLLDHYGPLTDATPAAAGQDGDGHG